MKKQRTATLNWYHHFGTSNTMSLEIMYRGRYIRAITGHSSECPKMLNSGLTWLKNQGYTHWRMKTNMQGPRSVRKLEV